MNHLDPSSFIKTSWQEGIFVEIAGRVVAFRNIGNVCFGKIVDQFGSIQFVLKKDVSPEVHKAWAKNIKLGDIIHISGKTWTSATNEKSILVDENITLLRRPIKPFPDKWKGIVDPETRIRKRYLDIILDPAYKQVFNVRAQVISSLRSILNAERFVEFETPILSKGASGAQAKAFQTHHNALNSNLYLRIAPETFLKRIIAASFDRVFEIGKNFRNEGMDPSHLQEFTSCEWYAAYWGYKENFEFFNMCIMPNLIDCSAFATENKNTKDGFDSILLYQGKELKFGTDIEKIFFRDVFQRHVGKDPFTINSAAEVDELFKKHVRPNLIQPVYIFDYPAHMCPLAKRKDDDERVAEQWQLIVNGWEIVKCYTELTDPILQRKLLEEQMKQRTKGDEEAMMLEEEFLECMEYGMPPMSGCGVGIDRLVALLTNQTSLRDVVMFPVVL